MKLISCEKLEKSMVELQFSIDAETFKSAVNTAFKREGKKYAIPGFRKGKAPKAMIEKMYGKDLFQYDAINDLFPENYEAAVKEAGIEVVGRPDPEVVSMSEDEGATLKVKVAVKPEVELGEYTGLTVNKDVKTVDEADVDAEIKRMQDRNGRLLTREGAAENGDTVDIDFEGFVDGVAFEGGKAEHYSLVLGSGSIYGRRMVLFAPLYLSSACRNALLSRISAVTPSSPTYHLPQLCMMIRTRGRSVGSRVSIGSNI